MASIKKQILGRLNGSVGDIVFKQRFGKPYAASKPVNVSVSTDPLVLERRAKFALTMKLAKTINSNAEIKLLWKLNAPIGLTSNNFIMRQNYALVQPSNISGLIKILPDSGFSMNGSNLTVTSSQISVSVGPIGTNTGIDAEAEANSRLYCILYLYDGVDESVVPHNFMLFSSAKQATVLDTAMTFNFGLTNQESLLFSNYHMTKAFFALVTLDGTDKIIHNSNTVTVV